MSDAAETRVRQGRPSDIKFITNSWLKSYRDSHTVKGCPNDLYYRYQHKVIDALLPTSGVLVLCDSVDDDFILGYVVYQRVEGMVLLHWLYIKHPFRRRHLAKDLIKLVLKAEAREDGTPPAVVFTHKTKGVNEILHHYRVAGREEAHKDELAPWVYDPYKLWLLLPEGWWK